MVKKTIKKHYNTLKRTVFPVQYEKTTISEDWFKKEVQFKEYVNILKIFRKHIKSLIAYEHGGHTYKSVLETLDLIGNKINLTGFKGDDMYLQGSLIADGFQRIVYVNEPTGNSQWYKEGMKKVSDAKIAMNEKLNKILNQLAEWNEESDNITEMIDDINHERYELEKRIKNSSDKSGFEDEIKKYHEDLEKLFQKMEDYLSSDRLNKLLKDVGVAQSEFFKVGNDELEKLN